MHSLQSFVAFSETVKHGGFAAAARELGSAPSTLAKAVARLEATLGLRLFHHIDDVKFRYLVLVFLLVAGFTLVL